MSGPITDETCAVFRDRLVGDALRPRTIHRFIVGRDTAVQRLTREQARAELGDPFATLLLLEGTFPNTAGDVLEGLDKATKRNDPLRRRLFFFLGEGTQVPVTQATRRVDRNLRFLVTTGSGPNGPDVLISTFHPESEDVELMAWDRKEGGFNYYRTAEGSNGWIFAGNSRHALEPDTQLKGPFESHTSGHFLMKELKLPWINWHSFSAPVPRNVLPRDVRDHRWFARKSGADVCELEVAIPTIQRWTRRRFERALAGDGVIEPPRRVMRQVLDSQTVNLHSSGTEGRTLDAGGPVGLPPTFFVDADTLSGVLGLSFPPGFAVRSALYAKTLRTFRVRWTDGDTFTRQGDTHFCFCVPERAFEDVETVRQAIEVGLLGRRFVASLLMVDFGNPVFSPRRVKLLDHTPERAVVKDGKSSFSREMVKNILAAAEGSPQGSPEREFAKRWEAGAGWKKEFDRLLDRYYRGVQRTLRTQEGSDGVFRVAEAARHRVRVMPIFESPLLFAATNIPAGARARMSTDGTVDRS